MHVASGVHAATDNEGGVVLNSRRGTVFSLNGTAATIWAAIEQGHSRDEVLAILVRTFPDRTSADLARDLDQFITDLIHHDLLVQ